MLDQVKQLIGESGSFNDARIQLYIDEVKQYLIDGGASEEIVSSTTSVGAIARGVQDLLYDGELSPYFKERAIQLVLKQVNLDDV